MRSMLCIAAFALTACTTGDGRAPFYPLAVQPPVTAGQPVAVCTPQAVLEQGRETRAFPPNCPANPALRDRHALGLEIARLEEELREVNYLIASADGPGLIGGPSRVFTRGFGSKGFLIGRRVDLKNAIRALEAEAART